MDEGAKETSEAGGDPGASMMKRKLMQSRIVTPKAYGNGPRTSRTRKAFMRAVSLDDLTRKVEGTTPSRRGGVVGRMLVTCARRHSPITPRSLRRPASPPDADRESEEGDEGEDEREEEDVEDSHCLALRSAALEEECAREAKAARRIYSVLVLRCWRRRRAEAEALKASLAAEGARAEGLALQTHVLRQLLDGERQRVADATDDARRTNARADKLQARLHETMQALEAEGAQAQELREKNVTLQEELGRALADATREVKGLQEEQCQMLEQLQMLKAHEGQLQEQLQTLQSHVDAQERDRVNLQASLLHLKCEKARLQEELRRWSWRETVLFAARRLASFSFGLFDLLLPYSRV